MYDTTVVSDLQRFSPVPSTDGWAGGELDMNRLGFTGLVYGFGGPTDTYKEFSEFRDWRFMIHKGQSPTS